MPTATSIRCAKSVVTNKRACLFVHPQIAMQILKPGGMLLTFSCSGLMEQNLFQKVVADAALDAGKDVLFMERLNQAADHPIASFYPEGFYLKGLVCKVF